MDSYAAVLYATDQAPWSEQLPTSLPAEVANKRQPTTKTFLRTFQGPVQVILRMPAKTANSNVPPTQKDI